MTNLRRGAGALTKRLIIQKRVRIDDSGAETSETYYEDIATVSASIEQAAGRESFAAQQVQTTADHLIRIRFVPWLTSEHRFAYWDSRRGKWRFFNIENVQDDPGYSGVYQDVYVKEWKEAPVGAGRATA